MLSLLGVGNAHPGGFSATLEQLKQYPLPKESRILEVGCGTGRTACFLAKSGHHVTGVDIDEEMLSKARRRAGEEQVQIDFVQGDIGSLPFPDRHFDIVLAESVTSFGHIASAASEYHRVLDDGGTLYDREVVADEQMPETAKREMVEFFGVTDLLTVEEWIRILKAGGFSGVDTWNYGKLPEESLKDEFEHPDERQYITTGAYSDYRVWQTSIKYSELLSQHRTFLRSVVLIGTK
jgi:SAM-dependent methyltransferase